MEDVLEELELEEEGIVVTDEMIGSQATGGKLMDLEATVHTKTRRQTNKEKAGKEKSGSSGKSSSISKAAPAPDHDIGVRGYLPRVNHTALVSRFHPTARPSSRYMHMATVAKVGDRFVAAWQGSRIYEGFSDQRIWHTFSKDETGRKWGPQRTIPMMEVGRVQWSPVLHMDVETGRLLLFYSESRLCMRLPPGAADGVDPATAPPPASPPPGLAPGDSTDRWVPGGDIKMAVLDIGVEAAMGRNYSWLRAVRWSSPTTLLSLVEPSGNAVPKVLANPLAVLSTGEWLLPFWREPHDAPPCIKENRGSAGVLRSRDRGKTWKVYGELTHPRTWLIENTLVERNDGAVLMIFRTSTGVLFQAVSLDKGKSWGEAVPTEIPNPDSKVQALRLNSGHLALVFNAHRKLKTFRKARSLLDLAISPDDGATWVRIARVDGELESGLRMHYPTMVESGGHIYVVYSKFYHDVLEGNRTDLGIHLVQINLEGRLPELGKPIELENLELPGAEKLALDNGTESKSSGSSGSGGGKAKKPISKAERAAEQAERRRQEELAKAAQEVAKKKEAHMKQQQQHREELSASGEGDAVRLLGELDKMLQRTKTLERQAKQANKHGLKGL
ncbi:hypothetical protein CYMTET_56683 [Cymbomonas tetramitiformis]|uniref:Sialidase domain-containing protein n=1 Tax=Cymbomonas tetramitiformis TaxID=36881 RepID=A0AAE0EMB2_9CHLO|nr:hypothetical protein CYMTET_56683 [Cymbomonas tetramitiformis]